MKNISISVSISWMIRCHHQSHGSQRKVNRSRNSISRWNGHLATANESCEKGEGFSSAPPLHLKIWNWLLALPPEVVLSKSAPRYGLRYQPTNQQSTKSISSWVSLWPRPQPTPLEFLGECHHKHLKHFFLWFLFFKDEKVNSRFDLTPRRDRGSMSLRDDFGK